MKNDGNITAALEFIRTQDPDFAHALTLIQPLPERRRPAGFEHLTKIIIEQQVSLASAEAIWQRLSGAVTPFVPERMLAHSEEALRALGLSRQKARYCRALAEEIQSNRLLLKTLHERDDEEVLSQLTCVKGIGRWTAEIYMISCLGRTDIWPAGDVALQTAFGHLKRLPTRPDAAKMDELAEPLRPYRTVAARILWRYYADVVQAPTRKKAPNKD
ncbi:DNA-3-methyladenine glycosylase family protein [Sneathiella litorea]|uniref:DNA-3-methyladenine glycosylase II n=1 Tax=Sneathiella litorea TaxID=2606216 RepID=A0A6L8W4G4_9PROT|nr:DNA-3-methyladenine glycosylase 2 family protein [Sneathiella litorea]MZR29971.1 DNA-3-methyladenine glycosylase 2 family protein [Sneathiella litorea]